MFVDSYKIGLSEETLDQCVYEQYKPGGADEQIYKDAKKIWLVDVDTDNKKEFVTADGKSLRPEFSSENHSFANDCVGFPSTRYPGRLKIGNKQKCFN